MRLDTHSISQALQTGLRHAERARNLTTRGDHCERIIEDIRIIEDGIRQYDALSCSLPALLRLQESSERAYDIYANSESECCSCHINPPCSFCVNEGSEG